ncbi:MAG: hypothetical protein ABJB66_05855 [Gemmatimonadaceae bacterium]
MSRKGRNYRGARSHAAVTRPRTAGEVLTPTLLVAVVALAGIALPGTSIVFVAMDTNLNMMMRILASTTLSSGEWALAALVIAGLTRDLRYYDHL